jgi:hypothetical protein
MSHPPNPYNPYTEKWVPKPRRPYTPNPGLKFVWPKSLGGPTDESLLKPIIIGTLQSTEPADTINAKERERRARISATMKARGIQPGPAARAAHRAVYAGHPSPKSKAVLAALAENRPISERALARKLGVSGKLIWKIKRAIHHEISSSWQTGVGERIVGASLHNPSGMAAPIA